MTNYREALQRQLTIANYLAPNGKAQAFLANCVNAHAAQGNSPSDTLVFVILFVANCLRDGKWPEE